MAITDIPELSDFGAPKASAFPTVDASKQIRADDFNEVCQRVIDVTNAVGLDDGSTSGSLRRSTALSVKGNATNATGAVADITAASDGQVLRRSGTALGFGTIATAGIADGAVTDAKLSSALQTTIGALVDIADPLSVFPSYHGLGTYAAYSDFLVGSSGVAPFTSATSGAGAVINWLTNPPANRIGILSLDTGTATNGYASVYAMNSLVRFADGRLRWRADMTIPTASDGTDTFIVRAGFGDAFFTAVDGSDAAFFRYTHSVNSGQWVCVTRSNSVETGSATNTSVTATPGSTTYQTLEIEVNAAGTSVDFRINGTTVATNTTNIPTGGSGRELGCGVAILKSAGTTSRSVYLDLQAVRYERSAAI